MKTWTMTFELTWEEAFDKFGYGDGDGPNGTSAVQDALEEIGYIPEAYTWGMHNYMIHDIFDQKGNSIIPKGTSVGYDDPREYLPKHIVEHLDKIFYGTGD